MEVLYRLCPLIIEVAANGLLLTVRGLPKARVSKSASFTLAHAIAVPNYGASD